MYSLLYRLLCSSCWLFGVDAEVCRKARRHNPISGAENFGR